MQEYELIYEAETDLAIGIRMEGEEEIIWLPKSQIEYDGADYEKDDPIFIHIPDWLAKEKYLF